MKQEQENERAKEFGADSSEKKATAVSLAEKELLGKTRRINNLLARTQSVDFGSISGVLGSVLNANVYITGKQGNILGYSLLDNFECDLMIDTVISKGEFPRAYVNWLMKIDKTSPNRRSKRGRCAYKENAKCDRSDKCTTIVPIYGGGERMGTLIVAKYGDAFNDGDLLLAEYGAAVVGMELLRDHTQKIEVDARKRATVQISVDTLSSSEKQAIINIIGALEGKLDGLLVTSKIAESKNITRSVVVNALRKLESAGIIESKSLGMKGTYIRILNEYLPGEMPKLREQLKNFEEALKKKDSF